MEKFSLTVKEAAAYIGIGYTKMYELVRENKVPNIKFGKRFVIPRVRFEQWADDVTVGGDINAR